MCASARISGDGSATVRTYSGVYGSVCASLSRYTVCEPMVRRPLDTTTPSSSACFRARSRAAVAAGSAVPLRAKFRTLSPSNTLHNHPGAPRAASTTAQEGPWRVEGDGEFGTCGSSAPRLTPPGGGGAALAKSKRSVRTLREVPRAGTAPVGARSTCNAPCRRRGRPCWQGSGRSARHGTPVTRAQAGPCWASSGTGERGSVGCQRTWSSRLGPSPVG
jgi:hypothetical protein